MPAPVSLLILCLVLTCGSSEGQTQFFIDPYVSLVDNFEGWGTSLAWWADVLGGMPDDVVDTITDAFFRSDQLCLNIVRYVIGGTTPENYTCGNYRPGAATESYLDGLDGAYNWTRDSRQRKILQIAKEKGADTFEAFSNSPPHWMTISGCSKGNLAGGLLHGNFASDQANNFASYISEVLVHFSQIWNITFESYAPFNEPYGLQGLGGWLGPASSQEGCNMAQDVMADTIRAMHSAFQERDILSHLAVADETQIDTAVTTQNYFRNQNLTKLIGKVSVHGYWDSAVAKRDVLYRNSVKDGHKLWMDEMGWGETPIDDMEQGLNIAKRIVTDLRNLMPSAWVYWQVLEDIGGWGLLSVSYEEPTVNNITYNSGFYSMMQFSRYIKKGSSIIHTTDVHSVAAYDAQLSQLVLVIVNPALEPSLSNFSLSLFDNIDSYFVIRTSPLEQHSVITAGVTIEYSTLSCDLPPESITTIVINATLYQQVSNLIQNGGFESSLDGWTAVGDAGVIDDDTWRGMYTGYVRNGTLRQLWTAEKSGTLFVSSWCSSAGHATLSIELNGIPATGSATTAVRNKLYATYGISTPVAAGDVVTLIYAAADSESFIDDVSAHMP